MESLRHILRLCIVMLFSVFCLNMAFAVPAPTSGINYFQAETTYFAQTGDVGFAARAPPITGPDIGATGGTACMLAAGGSAVQTESNTIYNGAVTVITGTETDGYIQNAFENADYSPEDARQYERWVEMGLAAATFSIETGAIVLTSKSGQVLRTIDDAVLLFAPNNGGDAVFPRVGAVNNPNGVRRSTNEQVAADAPTANGYDVNVLQRDLGVRRSDLTVDGFGRVDEYTPTNATKNSAVRSMIDKIGGGQADSEIVNVPPIFSNVDMYSSAMRVIQ
ncbi:hypothetical protein L0664_18175 [Octadecabacter sp. G9-8]|uniref:Uncharacterized protein n=1 Tax=Octadecabacter dasysiphoniae TaxID=2909341 RepID=A0ABS9D1B4_9RHOB|nr:hypothetical protein [Octadecabacter dasysiphoniae]MCF2872996.1 hypothetical protein [Octadecabacter dasysiphoniae]